MVVRWSWVWKTVPFSLPLAAGYVVVAHKSIKFNTSFLEIRQFFPREEELYTRVVRNVR